MEPLREAIAGAVRSRVGGPDAVDDHLELLTATGPRWYDPTRPVWTVHADASMFVGGLRALLLQTLHPLAMAGVAQHSDYRHDPWGRLQRTARFLAVTTYGTVDQADDACAAVTAVHERVRGMAPDGRHYEANDPHLLKWVHLAEVESFLVAYVRFGGAPISREDRDGYVEDMAVVARNLGVVDPPTDEAGLRAQLAAYRPELRGTREARDVARYLLVPGAVPLVARPAYGVLAAASIALLPWWAKLMLRLPVLPLTETVAVRPAGQAMVGVLRWALGPGSPTRQAPDPSRR